MLVIEGRNPGIATGATLTETAAMLVQLGKYTSQGSAFLIMMILGGAVIPPLQGVLGDIKDMHFSYLLAAACFAFLAYLALKLKNVLTSQGLDFDSQIGGGH